jgi:hypothetical protein
MLNPAFGINEPTTSKNDLAERHQAAQFRPFG